MLRKIPTIIITVWLLTVSLGLSGCTASTPDEDSTLPQEESNGLAWETLEEAGLSWHILTYQGDYEEACRYLSEKAEATTQASGGCEAFLPQYVMNHHLRTKPFDDKTEVVFKSWSESEEELRERSDDFNDGNGYYLSAIGDGPGKMTDLENATFIGYSNKFGQSTAAFIGWDEERGGWVITDFQFTR